MNGFSREETESRLETIETRMDGRIGVLEAKMDARFAEMSNKFSAKFAEIDVKFAELRAEMQKGFADMTKWIVGVFIAAVVINVTIMTFVLNNAAPKAVSTAPAAIYYIQPVLPAPANQPAPGGKQ